MMEKIVAVKTIVKICRSYFVALSLEEITRLGCIRGEQVGVITEPGKIIIMPLKEVTEWKLREQLNPIKVLGLTE